MTDNNGKGWMSPCVDCSEKQMNECIYVKKMMCNRLFDFLVSMKSI